MRVACYQCRQTIEGKPEYVLTKRTIVEGKEVIDNQPFHEEACLILHLISLSTPTCPIQHPHCSGM